MRIPRHITTYLKSLARGVVSSSRRYVRLSPNRRGRIYFLDKKKRSVFWVQSRNRIDSKVADQIYTLHEYRLDCFARFDDLKRTYRTIIETGKTPLIVDCGANIGLSARFLSDEFPEARIIAIEPDTANCDAARVNCSGREHVTIRHNAVGSTRGLVSIADPGADPWSYRTVRDRSDANIEVVKVDDIFDSEMDSLPFIVKVDIEGFEQDLFAANTEWVQRTPLLIVETHDRLLPGEANSRAFLQAISASPRDFEHRGENVFSFRNPTSDAP